MVSDLTDKIQSALWRTRDQLLIYARGFGSSSSGVDNAGPALVGGREDPRKSVKKRDPTWEP